MVNVVLLLVVLIRATVFPVYCVCNAGLNSSCCTEIPVQVVQVHQCPELGEAVTDLEAACDHQHAPNSGGCPQKRCSCEAVPYYLGERLVTTEAVALLPHAVKVVTQPNLNRRQSLCGSTFPQACIHGRHLRVSLGSLLI